MRIAAIAVVRAVCVAVCAVCVAACSFDGGLPADAQLACASGTCPDGFRCVAAIARCAPVSEDTTAPDIVDVVDPSPIGATPATLAFTVSEDLLVPPRVEVGAQAGDAVASGPRQYAFAVDGHLAGEGTLPARALLVDVSGNANEVDVLNVVVDLTPPALEAVDVTLVAPPGEFGVPSVVSLGVTARVHLRADEPLIDASLAGTVGGLDVVFVRDDDGSVADEAEFVYTRTIEAAGALLLTAHLVDSAQNEVDRPIGALGGDIVFSDVVPSPCTLAIAGEPRCTDADGDGHFGLSAGCAPPDADDCNDANPLVHPGAIEIPLDGFANACDATEEPPLDDSRYVFADPAGSSLDAGCGPRDAPCADLGEALALAAGTGRAVVATASTFTDPDGLEAGASLFGGFGPGFTAPSGDEKTLLLDGAGSGAAMYVGAAFKALAFSRVDIQTPADIGIYHNIGSLQLSDVRINSAAVCVSGFCASLRNFVPEANLVTFVRCDAGTVIVSKEAVLIDTHVRSFVFAESLTMVRSVVDGRRTDGLGDVDFGASATHAVLVSSAVRGSVALFLQGDPQVLAAASTTFFGSAFQAATLGQFQTVPGTGEMTGSLLIGTPPLATSFSLTMAGNAWVTASSCLELRGGDCVRFAAEACAVDPCFVDPASAGVADDDVRLLANSPLAGAGAPPSEAMLAAHPVASAAVVDIDGRCRATWDTGAAQVP